jgi:hypothetical protein
MKFPSPLYEGKRRYWRESSVINFERALEGLPPLEIEPSKDRLLTAAQVRTRFGGVSDMWLWRRTAGADRQLGQAA